MPPAAILVKGTDVNAWLQQLHGLDVSLLTSASYAIPGTQANSLWGCVIMVSNISQQDVPPTIGYLSLVANTLLIPQYAALFPSVGDDEVWALFKDYLHFLHPETGLVALEQTINWHELLTMPAQAAVPLIRPANAIHIPSVIHAFEVKAAPAEEQIAKLEQQLTPEKKRFNNEPLDIFENLKMALYKKIFSATGKGKPRKLSEWADKILSFVSFLGIVPIGVINRMATDLDSLEERNETEVNKLLELFRSNPSEALKYAIPLGDGATRGGQTSFNLSKRWSQFSLFGTQHNQISGGTVDISDEIQNNLRNEYERTAQVLIAAGEYEKAAFVYLKLLKRYNSAAETLAKGGMYAEAAAIHMKFTGSKELAADFYRKGNMLSRAIELYIELGKLETVGDLYMQLGQRQEANIYYQKVLDTYMNRGFHYKAAMLLRDKMMDNDGSQKVLMQGWLSGRDCYTCLQAYLSAITDAATFEFELSKISETFNDKKSSVELLKVLKNTAVVRPAASSTIRSLAYSIIATQADKKPDIISKLTWFNKTNHLITKDIGRYRNKKI